MVRVYFTRIRPDKVDRLRAWMKELSERHDESIEAMNNDTIRSEAAYLIDTSNGPILVHASDADDPEFAERMRYENKLPLAEDFRTVMHEVMIEPMSVTPIFEKRA
jgi:hypothetical protein